MIRGWVDRTDKRAERREEVVVAVRIGVSGPSDA